MVVKATDYNTGKSPRSWAKIIAMRHALSQYPDATFVWFLDQNAYIMDLDRTLEAQVMAPAKLESLMIKDWPVVPPDSIIKTFSHLKGGDAALIISQDDTGLVTNSYVLRNGDWAKFFIETWMDPLYQSYNFQKAERHALVSSISPTRSHVLTPSTGAHCAMASHDPLQARARAAADVCLVRTQQGGQRIPGRRLCHAHGGLHHLGCHVLREAVALLPAAADDKVR